jgi:hypothetical protein
MESVGVTMSTFANIITGQRVDVLPARIGSTWNPIWEQLREEGWRKVANEEKPQEGERVLSRKVIELDEDTCSIAIASKVSIAAEQAAVEEAQAELAARVAAAKADPANLPNYIKFAVQFHLATAGKELDEKQLTEIALAEWNKLI